MRQGFDRTGVAPFTGAWIETRYLVGNTIVGWSHPSRVRGLKLSTIYTLQNLKKVAPFTGAWIETPKSFPL